MVLVRIPNRLVALCHPNFQLSGLQCQQVAFLKNLAAPPKYREIEYPQRRKLKYFEKVPQIPADRRPPKMMRDISLMRGPEEVHNQLQYGDFGIQALQGGRLRNGHLEMIRLTIGRKMDDKRMFAHWRVDQPWQAVTKKGLGHRMGGGKGAIDHYVFPLKARRIIVEMGGECEFVEVKDILQQVARLLPFKARVVSREILEEEKLKQKTAEEKNINPFSFKYCAKNNILGCKIWLSPYDHIWHGKYR